MSVPMLRNMDTAPKDRRILIKRWMWGYSPYAGKQVRLQTTSIVECWWHEGKWRLWCGAVDSMSTDYIDPIAWAEIPKELRG